MKNLKLILLMLIILENQLFAFSFLDYINDDNTKKNVLVKKQQQNQNKLNYNTKINFNTENDIDYDIEGFIKNYNVKGLKKYNLTGGVKGIGFIYYKKNFYKKTKIDLPELLNKLSLSDIKDKNLLKKVFEYKKILYEIIYKSSFSLKVKEELINFFDKVYKQNKIKHIYAIMHEIIFGEIPAGCIH